MRDVAALKQRKILSTQGRRVAAADLQRDHLADLLRVHPAQGRPGFREGNFQGALRRSNSTRCAAGCWRKADAKCADQGCQPWRRPCHLCRATARRAATTRARAATTPAPRTTRLHAADHDTTGACTRASRCNRGLACREFIDAVRRSRTRTSRASTTSPAAAPATGCADRRRAGLIPERGLLRPAGSAQVPGHRLVRKPGEFDYFVEPDVFMTFRPCALLFNPVFADYSRPMAPAAEASRLDACRAAGAPVLVHGRLAHRHPRTACGLWRRHRRRPASCATAFMGLPQAGPAGRPHCSRALSPSVSPSTEAHDAAARYNIDTYQSTYFVTTPSTAVRGHRARLHADLPRGAGAADNRRRHGAPGERQF